MSKWHAEIEKGMAAFARETEEGRNFSLIVFPASNLEALDEACEAGDEEARRVAGSIAAWADTANKGWAEGHVPGCAHCDADIEKGELAGWIIVVPRSPKTSGLISALCTDCIRLEHDKLHARAMEIIARETGAEVARVN